MLHFRLYRNNGESLIVMRELYVANVFAIDAGTGGEIES